MTETAYNLSTLSATGRRHFRRIALVLCSLADINQCHQSLCAKQHETFMLD